MSLSYGLLTAIAALAVGSTFLTPNPEIAVVPTNENNHQPLPTTPSDLTPTPLSLISPPETTIFATPNPEILTPSTPKTIASPKPKLITAFQYVRPKTADNGSLFPKTSGYIKGYPLKIKGGLSSLTVDNSQGDSDAFVKLYDLSIKMPQPVRVFFVRAGEKFTAEKIKAGDCDVRYKNLNNGGLLRTQKFSLKEVKTSQGINYHNLTLTLYKVPHGKMKTYPISGKEFGSTELAMLSSR
jgi:hypothetical protein